MKKPLLYFAIITLATSCHNEESFPENYCNLTKMAWQEGSIEYNYTNGKISSRVLADNNFNRTYLHSYGSDGKLSKVEYDNIYFEIVYSSDKVSTVTYKNLSGDIISVDHFTFGTNSLTIKTYPNGQLDPEEVLEYTFNGDNIDRLLVTSYVDYANNVKGYSYEQITLNYESTLSPEYLWMSRSPGFPYPSSKNNPSSARITTTPYNNGIAQTPYVTTNTYTYTNGSHNSITAQSISPTSGDTYNFNFIYSNCANNP